MVVKVMGGLGLDRGCSVSTSTLGQEKTHAMDLVWSELEEMLY